MAVRPIGSRPLGQGDRAVSHHQNRLLASLPKDELEALKPHLKPDERPRSRRATEERDELAAAHHSITSSARRVRTTAS